jgi:NADH-quinone oxidoreductase subunit M
MSGTPWMLVLGVVPLAGTVLVGGLGLAKASDQTAKVTALAVSLIELVITIIACAQFKPHGAVFQFTTSHNWISELGVHFSLGADGIALALVALTAVLTPVVILASWHEADGGRSGVPTYFALLLALECLLVGVFSATDVFLFYVFFEAMLIPMYILIGVWGS